MIEITINSSINSLKRLKDAISNYFKVKNFEKLRIFNHKALELEDSDIEYLTNGQVLYVSEGNINRKIRKNF